MGDFLNISEPVGERTKPIVVLHNPNSQAVRHFPNLGPALQSRSLRNSTLLHIQILVYPAVQKVSPWLIWENGWSILLSNMSWEEIATQLTRCRSIRGVQVYYHIHHQYSNWELDGLGEYLGMLGFTVSARPGLQVISNLAGF